MKQFFAVLSLALIFFPQTLTFSQPENLLELNSINFVGNNEFSGTELKSVIQSKETPFWLWKFFDSFTPFGSAPNYFDSTQITVDVVSLKSFYSVNGFFQAEISYSYITDLASKSAELNYYITEGKEFTYGNINVYGLEELTTLAPIILPRVKLPVWERFNQDKLSARLNEALSLLKNNGYMLSSFDSTVIEIDTVLKKTNLDIYFTTGNKYTYSEIIVEKNGPGSSLVSDNLIRYVTKIQPGDIYNEEEIEKSRLRLARTGLFNTINLKGVVEDTVGTKVPLQVLGNIGILNELSPEIFIDNEFSTSNIGVGLSYTRKNFFGDARKLTLSTKFKINDIQNIKLFSSSARDSTIQTQVDLSMLLEQPFLFSRSISASLEAYYKTYNISFTPFENGGGKLRLAFDMPTHTFVNLLNPYLTFDILGYDLTSVDKSFNYSPRSTTSIFGTDLGSTTANDYFYPFKGYNLIQIVELALTRTKITTNSKSILDSLNVKEDAVGLYYRLQTSFADYFSVSRDNRTVVAFKIKIGYIQTFIGGDELIPPNQTFFGGGANSVRGWKARQLVPKNQVNFIGVTNPVEDNIRGGTFILEGSFEYRRKFHPQFGYVLFADYGNTWNGYKEFQLKQIAVATGFGIRYYSDIAPIRIDFGWKLWDPEDQRTIFIKPFWKSFEFHFGIGEAF